VGGLVFFLVSCAFARRAVPLTTNKRPPLSILARKNRRLLDPHALREEKGIRYHINHLRVLWTRGDFPAPFNLSPPRIAWFEEDIDDWIAAKAKEKESV
jgi:Prophage CP4-57 regulatory protein (AlpA)